MLRHLIKITAWLLLPWTIMAFGAQWLGLAAHWAWSAHWGWFIAGAGLGAMLRWLGVRYLSGSYGFITTFLHETAHALVGLATGNIPCGLEVTGHEGGQVRLLGLSPGNILVNLAPYFLPLLSFFVIGGAWWFGASHDGVLLFLLGCAAALDLTRMWEDLSWRQSDLTETGKPTCLAVLPVAQMIMLGALLAFVAGGQGGFVNYWSHGSQTVVAQLRQLLDSGKAVALDGVAPRSTPQPRPEKRQPQMHVPE